MSEQEFENLEQEQAAGEAEFSIDDLIRETKQELEALPSLRDESDASEQTDLEQILREQHEKDMPKPAPKRLPAREPISQEEEERQRRKFRMPSGVRVLIYVCLVLSASVLLAIGLWLCADDVLALSKPDRTVMVTIEDGAGEDAVCRELQENGLIRYDWLFRLYYRFSHADQKIMAGTYELNNLYDYHALVNAMRQTSGLRATVTVMIPEGFECKDIFALLEQNGVCSVTELERAAASYEFDFDFLSELPFGDANRLEGYLFPDTYEFYVNDSPENVLGKFLRNFDNKLTQPMRESIDALNQTLRQQYLQNGFTEEEADAQKLTLHDIVIVASLIEKETSKTSESATIASVIYNRLTSQLYPCLQLDATVQYVLAERKEKLTEADKAVISPYNTYKNAGLPAGPISNPGMGSFRAALNPAESDYYFYALGNDGVHHFFENYYDHQDFLNETE